MKMSKLTLGGYTLCAPTYVYLVLSLVSFIMIIASNIDVSMILIFIVKVLIWVFLLNLMCANGLVGLAWFFVLLPFILVFIGIIYSTAVYDNDQARNRRMKREKEEDQTA